jgi:YggT family protein
MVDAHGSVCAMTGQDAWWTYWYFHFPNYALAVLFWTLIGRFMFSIFLRPDSPNYIYRWFRRLTDWLIRPVTFITPSMMPRLTIAPIAAFCVAMARVAFFMTLYAAGLTPRLAQ